MIALAAALVAVVLTAPSALAAPPPIPADVQEVFAGEALRQARAGGDGVGADVTGATVTAVHEIHAFSEDFIRGRRAPDPLTSTQQWQGALVRGDDVLGTVDVWRNGGGPAQPNGYSDDTAGGQALISMRPTEILVFDEPNGAHYAVDGTTVRPLNDWARRALPEPADLSELQETVAAQYAAIRDDMTAGEPAAPGLAFAVLGMGLALLVGGALMALGQRRRPLSGTWSGPRQS